MSGEMLSLSMKAPLNTTLGFPLVGEFDYVPARSLKKGILKPVSNQDAPMLEYVRRLHMDGRPSSLWCVCKRTPVERVWAQCGTMRYGTL